jgi:hypothetical protein
VKCGTRSAERLVSWRGTRNVFGLATLLEWRSLTSYGDDMGRLTVTEGVCTLVARSSDRQKGPMSNDQGPTPNAFGARTNGQDGRGSCRVRWVSLGFLNAERGMAAKFGRGSKCASRLVTLNLA